MKGKPSVRASGNIHGGGQKVKAEAVMNYFSCDMAPDLSPTHAHTDAHLQMTSTIHTSHAETAATKSQAGVERETRGQMKLGKDCREPVKGYR